MWIISFGLILNGIYQAWSLYQKVSMVFLVWSIISISAAIGLLYRKEWSKYFVLFLSSMSVASWFDGVFYYFQHGPRYETLSLEIAGLIPGAFLITWWICIFIYVFRYFKKSNEYNHQLVWDRERPRLFSRPLLATNLRLFKPPVGLRFPAPQHGVRRQIMAKMKSSDIKIILIGTIISLIVNPFTILIHTFIEFSSTVEIGIPLTQYFLYGYSPLAIAGIYIALTKSDRIILISILVGILYGISGIIFDHYFYNYDYVFSKHFESSTVFILIRHIDKFLLYIILVSGSCAITSYIKKRYPVV